MSKENKTKIEGEYTDAIIFLPRENIEDELYNQVQDLIDHPAFRNKVRMQPDCHFGKGAPIGFTMPLTNRVCVNTIGVDIGCGMYAFKLSNISFDPESKEDLKQIDKEIRNKVPMGMNVNDEDPYHIKNQFPWSEVDEKWMSFATNHLEDIPLGKYDPSTFNYDNDYFVDLCRKVGANINRAISSVGSLGGGNHYIEIGKDSQDEIWGTIHSGSRGLGYKIAEYHQERSEDIRGMESIRKGLLNIYGSYDKYIVPDIDNISDSELHKWIHNKQIVDYEKLKNDFGGTEKANLIEKISNIINGISRGQFKEYSKYIENVDVDELHAMEKSEELAYLEGEEAVEYYVDMAFAQTYASESRKEMAKAVENVTGGEIIDSIESVHNYIDYNDGIMRKGSTPARDGQRAIIPMNMSFGSFIVRGKGNEEWNLSAPHGAGRTMSRNQAHNELDKDEFIEEMGETFASQLPLDEAPMAYKDVEMVRKAMEPTVEIIDRVEPFLNLKAE